MNNYLISIIDTESPYNPLFYRIEGTAEEDAKDKFIEKTFKALYDFGTTWSEIEDLLGNKSVALTITKETNIETLV